MKLGYVVEDNTPTLSSEAKENVMRVNVDIVAMYDDVKIPEYKSPDAVGADLYAYIKEGSITINPHETVFIGTGVKMDIPTGLGAFIFARSGLSCKEDLAPANKVGVVDPDYRGEIMVALHNHGTASRTVKHGDRIAQIAFMPYLIARFHKQNSLTETERGDGGFGHTGK